MYKFLLCIAASLALLVSCQEEDLGTVDTSLSFITKASTENLVQYGILREGFEAGDGTTQSVSDAPYVTLYFKNATAGDIIGITDTSDQEDISIAGYYTFTNDGSGVMYLSLKGTPTSSGTRYISFRIECGGKYWYVDDLELYVRAADEDVADLELSSIDMQAVIMRDLDIRVDYSDVIIAGDDWSNSYLGYAEETADGKCQIILYYRNGWSRSVSFSLNEECGINIDESTTYTLAEGAGMTGVILPITGGRYEGFDESIQVQITATENSEAIASNSFAVETTAALELDMQVTAGWELSQDIANDETKYFGFSYTGGDEREITAEITLREDFAGISASSTSQTLLSDDGNFTIALSGTPEVSGTLKITVVVSGDAIETPLTYDFDITVNDYAEPIIVSEVRLVGPTIEGGDEDEYKLEVDYTGGASGVKLSVAGITSDDFSISEADFLTIEATQLTGEGGTATINLGLCLNTDIANASIPTSASATFKLMYNSVALDDSINAMTASPEVTGFKHTDGLYYNAVAVGTDYWLDRNVGASKKQTNTVTFSGTKVASWTPDFDTYGLYYQRNRPNGISIMTDKAEAKALLLANSLTATNYPYFVDEADNVPFFMSVPSSNTGATYWVNNIWCNSTSSLVPSSKDTAAEVQAIVDQWWTLEGDDNPCPSGYRVPTMDEIKSMIETKASITLTDYAYTTANTGVLDALVNGDMAFGLTGKIADSGPTMKGATSTTGQDGMVGFYGTGTSPSIITADNGSIYIMSIDYDRTATSGSYLYATKIDSSGKVSWVTNLNRYAATPIRCIKDNSSSEL